MLGFARNISKHCVFLGQRRYVCSKPLYEIAGVKARHKAFYAWFFCWLDPWFYIETMVLDDSAQGMGSGRVSESSLFYRGYVCFFSFAVFSLTGSYMKYKFDACFLN